MSLMDTHLIPKRLTGGLRTNGIEKQSLPGLPLLSVVLPVLNDGHIVGEAIESVVGQSYTNVELIIADGGSTDTTLDVLKKYEAVIDLWLSEADDGIYDAMNKGTELANGDWLYFLGADDRLVNCLHQIVPQLKKRHCIYYGDVYLVKKNRVYNGKFRFHTLIQKNICHQSIVYPRTVFAKYRYNTKYKILADYELNIKCWGDRAFRFKYIPVLVCVYNDRGSSEHIVDHEFQSVRSALIEQHLGGHIRRRQLILSFKEKLGQVLDLVGLRIAFRSILNRSL